ncbi:acyl-CoA synthetase [Ilumatobacter nonamiensis]|uniref:acyl-CoA synthetase n=1 Tax=Ilumatobacter nonamiensis TaxID=467093 RepID=UPI00034A708B|nr:acyl-CoA synthetase [Ilumatobacter nonamiensis]
MEMHFATVWESIADAIPDHVAITHADTSRTWAEFDDRAARVAQAFTAAGLGPDSKIALYLYNGNEYMESHYAAFKMRGVAVNVNYRYLDEELWYLLDNSDAEAIVFHRSLAERVGRVVERLPKLKLLIVVDDEPGADVPDAVEYEQVVADNEPMERIERSEDDTYMLYTGGTTGMPKGVMYQIGGLTEGFILQGFPIVGLEPPADATQVADMVKGSKEAGSRMVSIPCAPLMHGTGCWIGWFIPMCAGAEIVTLTNRSLDPHEVLQTIEDHKATSITIVGDSFAKPLVRAIDEGKPDGGTYDLSSVVMFLSSGVMWTTEVKQQMLERIPQAVLVDAMGSSEGSMGTQITMAGVETETAKFTQMPTTKVFTDDDREVTPGSDEVGMVAAGGNVPFGYYKDPEKSARTFRTIDGVRYSFPGDLAMVAADGTLELLGRGSQVINTGGEKVFPEEVEEAVKRVDGVLDCLVVGVENEKFGQAVTAVASLAEGVEVDEATVITAVKNDLAGYKAPKSVVFVSAIPRAPNGKADYKAARALADAAMAQA